MTPQIRDLFEQFASNLAQVFESMADQRPKTICEAHAVLPDGETMLWWEQPLQFAPDMKIWAGAPQTTWEYCGTLTLKAAGLESVGDSEARNTWLEILGQALSPTARAVGAILDREVACEGGSETAPPAGIVGWTLVRLTFADAPPTPLYIAFSPRLIEVITTPPAPADVPAIPEDRPGPEAPFFPERSRTMGLLLDVDLPVSISFGKTQLPLREVIKLTTGSIVELNRGVGDPVEVLVNQSLVARGEVVVVEGNYGVRILEIASRLDRMRSLR